MSSCSMQDGSFRGFSPPECPHTNKLSELQPQSQPVLEQLSSFPADIYARMLGIQSLTFKDPSLEAQFRRTWDNGSRMLVVLLSLLTGLVWAVATLNIHTHCQWSRTLCMVVEAICCANVALQAYFQFILRRDTGWNISEKSKASVHVWSLICSMVFILLLRDLEEVPGGTHDWMYACHGWAILFLQVTCVSAFHLHLLNLLAYWVVEAYLVWEFGWGSFLKSGLSHVFLICSMCGVLPLAANAAIEMRSRRAFLQRHSRHPAARSEWLLGHH